MNADTITADLLSTLHKRVDGTTFLPLAIRANRIEDVFLSFLKWLGDEDPDTIVGADFSQSPSEIADLIIGEVQSRSLVFAAPTDEAKLALLRRWIRAEIVVTPRHSNVDAKQAASVMPLHTVVGESFDPPGQAPAYGRFLCECLSRDREGEIRPELLNDLRSFFGDAGKDYIATLLRDALSGAGSDSGPRYMTLLESGQPRRVWSPSHTALFQEKVRSALQLQHRVARRTMLDWLYALIAFFSATYFLRMANAATAFSVALEEAYASRTSRWTADIDDPRFAPTIPYGRRDEEHGRTMKQFPAATSQFIFAQRLVELILERPTAPGDLPSIEQSFVLACNVDGVNDVLDAVVDQYPTQGSGRGSSFKLSVAEKAAIIDLARRSGISRFELATRNLNFEDMARRSNNVIEWEFYKGMAAPKASRDYGFAISRGKEVLEYRMSKALLVALVHCHCVENEGEPTLSSLLADLEQIGFAFDGDGRRLLEQQLIDLGLLESLSDASDAKTLVPFYSIKGAAT